MKSKWMLLLLPLFVVLAGCQERYRYPCQDPDNWDTKECKKPFCSANGTCPEDLTHYEKPSSGFAPATPAPTRPTIKGDCKC